MLANFGITELRRGVKPIRFIEIKDTFLDFLIMLLPSLLSVIGIICAPTLLDYVFVFVGFYLTFKLRKKMKIKLLFVFNLITSVLCAIVCILGLISELITWLFL